MEHDKIETARVYCSVKHTCGDAEGNCPLIDYPDCFNYLREKTYCVDADALDLINRLQADKEALINGQETLQKHIAEQKAEIERLNIRNKALTEITKFYDWKFAKAKSEAIKEFAERLKEEYAVYEGMGYVEIDLDDLLKNIDNLVKEMTE